ncbi:DUF1178 family protein [Hyphomonas sp. UBA4494]|jgi:hypothetical protein|uniref:DUF1178 family protein n=1 Tax=Hyphomonas sp. UBA4494 TaxID=1946631 RepID=UPI0025B89F39|nr:DUF1178 family protein [Hyphomonas sp. UBA4494]
MIRYALICSDCDHDFEAWFASSSAFDDQSSRGLVSCAMCGGENVVKQIMAPSVRTSDGRKAAPDEAAMAREILAKARDHVSRNFDYVGDSFADEARSMFYGETDNRPIWGETSAEESEALREEGIPAAPLPRAMTPKRPKSNKQLN